MMTLKEVAKNMHEQAKQRGKSVCRLSKGLQLGLYYRKLDVVLSLSRDNVEPSDVEVRTCKAHFFGDDAELTNQAQRGNTIYIAVEREKVS
jgi:hypothetical protein